MTVSPLTALLLAGFVVCGSGRVVVATVVESTVDPAVVATVVVIFVVVNLYSRNSFSTITHVLLSTDGDCNGGGGRKKAMFAMVAAAMYPVSLSLLVLVLVLVLAVFSLMSQCEKSREGVDGGRAKEGAHHPTDEADIGKHAGSAVARQQEKHHASVVLAR
jgi:hypothetical protein